VRLFAETKPRAVLGLHVDPELAVGAVGWSEGPVFASSDRFSIEITGKAAHGAYPDLGVDPMPVVAAVIQASRRWWHGARILKFGGGVGRGVSPHRLRHSYATHLLRHGAPLVAVQALLGHASLVSTEVYLAVETSDLARMLQRTHPREARGDRVE
jgi:hypothetical protein